MKISIGSDHAGLNAKSFLSSFLQSQGHDVEDVGTHTNESCDYPDFAMLVAKSVAQGKAERGILVCGSGIGMSITANKIQGIRAALCMDETLAKLSRLHNDCNVLCLGARVTPFENMQSILDVWLKTSFEGGRHSSRIEKISQIEKENQ